MGASLRLYGPVKHFAGKGCLIQVIAIVDQGRTVVELRLEKRDGDAKEANRMLTLLSGEYVGRPASEFESAEFEQGGI